MKTNFHGIGLGKLWLWREGNCISTWRKLAVGKEKDTPKLFVKTTALRGGGLTLKAAVASVRLPSHGCLNPNDIFIFFSIFSLKKLRKNLS